METVWDLLVAIAALIVIYAVCAGLVNLLWPEKVRADDYESPDTWGSQDLDSRKRRKTK
jgi:hypothetical protein